MGKKLYVGNLSFTVSSDRLTEMFSEVGAVDSVNIITDRDTGRSKGFAFVEMSSDSEAQSAIEKLNGMDCEGRAMNISEAKPQEPRSGGGGGFRRNNSSWGSSNRRSY